MSALLDADFWRSRRSRPLIVILAIALLVLTGAVLWSRKKSPVYEHVHDPGKNGGIIVPVGEDHYHVEAVFAKGGVLKLFTLDHDQSQVLTVPKQQLTAYVRGPSF